MIDIELELPSVNAVDGAGSAFTGSATSSFNFSWCRVRLAQIQGQVYNSLAEYWAGTSMAPDEPKP
jgi:hypothetical protein